MVCFALNWRFVDVQFMLDHFFRPLCVLYSRCQCGPGSWMLSLEIICHQQTHCCLLCFRTPRSYNGQTGWPCFPSAMTDPNQLEHLWASRKRYPGRRRVQDKRYPGRRRVRRISNRGRRRVRRSQHPGRRRVQDRQHPGRGRPAQTAPRSPEGPVQAMQSYRDDTSSLKILEIRPFVAEMSFSRWNLC